MGLAPHRVQVRLPLDRSVLCLHVLHTTRVTDSESKLSQVSQIRVFGSTMPFGHDMRSHLCHPASNSL